MNNLCIYWRSRIFLLRILIFKGLTARRFYKPFCVNGLTNIAREATVDRPDDGCTAEVCSLLLLTYIHIVVIDCILLYQ
jgi:hypothetical protein